MKYSLVLAISALVASACASPHARHLDLHKRQVVHTYWEKVIVTKTITLQPGQQPPSQDQYQPQAADAKKAPANNSPAQPTSTPNQINQAHVEHKAPKEQQKAAPAQPAASPSTINKLADDQNSQPALPSTTPAYGPPATPTAVTAPVNSIGGPTDGSGPSGGSFGSVGFKCYGDVTMYNDQGAGACGWTNDTNTEDYFALAIGKFGSYTNNMPGPNKNKNCGRKANIVVNGKTVSGTLTDACGGCTGDSIDLSQSLWNKAYPGQAGARFHDIEWYFTDPEIYSQPPGQ